MAVVGCYSLDLYCDRDGQPYGEACPHRPYHGAQAQFTGRNERECIAQARKDGWKFNADKVACICPKCAKEGVRP